MGEEIARFRRFEIMALPGQAKCGVFLCVRRMELTRPVI